MVACHRQWRGKGKYEREMISQTKEKKRREAPRESCMTVFRERERKRDVLLWVAAADTFSECVCFICFNRTMFVGGVVGPTWGGWGVARIHRTPSISYIYHPSLSLSLSLSLVITK